MASPPQPPSPTGSSPSVVTPSNGVFALLLILTLGLVAGRIATVRSADGATAFLSANDRSRWATVIALVEDGTYQIDRSVAHRDPIHRNRRPFDSIDKVQHLGKDGRQHFYSSKPPLLATLVAGVYAIVSAVTGMTISQYPTYVPRIVLAIVNLPVLAIFIWSTDRSCRRWGRSDESIAGSSHTAAWRRTFLVAAIGLGTMLTPMAISLNNHLIAAAASALAMKLFLDAADRRLSFGGYAVAGSAAAMAAANELPALSMLVGWVVLFAWLDRRSVIGFVAGAAIVSAAFFGTNYLAHQSFRMPYAHRGNGALITTLDGLIDPASGPTLPTAWRDPIQSALGDGEFAIQPSDEDGRHRLVRDEAGYALVATDSGNTELRHWDDWYEYPGSYWQDGRRRGVDRGEPSRARYLFHMTWGHHGVFSITPLWILVPMGWAWVLLRNPMRVLSGARVPSGTRVLSGTWVPSRTWASAPEEPDRRRDAALVVVALATLAATLVCVAFYVRRPLIDRNYGGVSVCFRWLLWLAPMWIFSMTVAVDRLARGRVGRGSLLGMLGISVASMATALQNPWQSPWIYQYLEFLGVIQAG